MVKTSRAMYRLRLWIASSFEWPWAMRRATYSWIVGSSRNRPIAMMCKALFAARSPPLFNRCLMVLPDEAGTGLTPHKAANLVNAYGEPFPPTNDGWEEGR